MMKVKGALVILVLSSCYVLIDMKNIEYEMCVTVAQSNLLTSRIW